MNHPGRKRLYFGAGIGTAIAAVAALVLGVTFGLFSSQSTTGSQTFTAGTVTLNNAAIGQCTLDAADVKPGDSGWCPVSYNYSGNPAWFAVDVAGTSTAATSPSPEPIPYGGTTAPAAKGLFDGSNPMQVWVTAANNSTLTGTNLGLASGNSYKVANVLLSSPAAGGASAPSGTQTFWVHWSLPLAAGNEYQGSGATLTMTVHAVQAKNNPTANTDAPQESLSPGCAQYAVCTVPTWA